MLKLTNITKTYPDRLALDHINLTLDPRETTVIVGPSGSGKSTLLRTLNLLEEPESGTYQLDDTTLDFATQIPQATRLWVRRQTGMVFQQPRMFDHLTVLGNLIEAPMQVLKQSKAEATQSATTLLAEVGLAGLEDRYPYQLSGGQTQRVAIARALAMQPKYLLLDEPTSALDPEIEAQILRLLKKMAATQSLIIVTHNLAFARQAADRILFLEDGRIDFDGTPDEFFAEPTPRIAQFLDAFKL